MAMTGSGMANKVVDDLVSAGKLDGLSASDITKLKDDMTVTYTSVVDYIIANMEISGLTISATGVINTPVPPIPVPTDGGAAILTTMISNTATKSLSQNNNGTGLIS